MDRNTVGKLPNKLRVREKQDKVRVLGMKTKTPSESNIERLNVQRTCYKSAPQGKISQN